VMAAGPDEQPELHFPRRHIRHSLVLSHHPSTTLADSGQG
jgi:hypothetical protein